MSYCVNPIEDYSPDACDTTYAGGIRHAIIFVNALPSNPSSGSEISGMIASGAAKLVTNIKVGIELPAEISVERMISCKPATVANYDRTATWMDDTVNADNIDFYNSINASKGFQAAGLLLYQCDTARCSFIDEAVSFSGGLVIPNDNIELQHFNFTLKWKSKNDAPIVTAPAGVFPTN
jgi:hypothetical protein